MWNIFTGKRTQKERIYLDYASATPVLKRAMDAVHAAGDTFGNPGSIHAEGVAAAHLLQDSRERIAKEIGCKAREIIFTSGGNEANNLAILGFARAIERAALPRTVLGSDHGPSCVAPLAGTHWIVSSIEHPSVLECFGEIERLGAKVSFVDPDKDGIIRPEKVVRILRPETIFISIGWANSEIGVVQ